MSDKKQINNTGEGIEAITSSWTFEGISNVFDQHIEKSVPMYKESHELITGLTDYFVQKGSKIVDLGSSTGSLIKKISERHNSLESLEFF